MTNVPVEATKEHRREAEKILQPFVDEYVDTKGGMSWGGLRNTIANLLATTDQQAIDMREAAAEVADRLARANENFNRGHDAPASHAAAKVIAAAIRALPLQPLRTT